MIIEMLPRVSLLSLMLPMSTAVVLLPVRSWLPLFLRLVMVQLERLLLVVLACGMGFLRGVVSLVWSVSSGGRWRHELGGRHGRSRL